MYLFKDSDSQVVYVGKAKNLRTRVRSYFTGHDTRAKIKHLVPVIHQVEVVVTQSEWQALLLEAELIRQFQPKFNTEAKDDKRPVVIGISKQPWPVVKLMRQSQVKPGWQIYGPYQSHTQMRSLLQRIRRLIPFSDHPARAGKPCLYHHLGWCDPCPNLALTWTGEKQQAAQAQYLQQIKYIRAILRGQSKQVIRAYRQLRDQASLTQDYRTADKYHRIQLQLDKWFNQPQDISQYLNSPLLQQQLRQFGLSSLLEILSHSEMINPPLALDRIEAYDIAHLAGQETAGAMVVFSQGWPEPASYRQFKIKKVKPGDDYAAMQQLLTRRAQHWQDWGKPDLMVIDGGRGQLSKAVQLAAIQQQQLSVIALAKQRETIWLPVGEAEFRPLSLPQSHPALQVIQHIRDEAHRFSRRYHHKLRHKQIFNP